MRHVLVGLTIVIVACGGDSSGPAPGFECVGDALPTTAPALVQVDGQILGNALSPGPISNAIVTAFRVGVTDSIAIDTSNTPGFYALSLTTGGTPVNGYLRARHSGQVDTYAYPSRPLAANLTTNVLMPTQAELDFLALAVGVTQSVSNGLIGVVVLDCNGVEVEGATVSINPAGSSVVRYNAVGGAPSATATSTSTDGVAYVFNAPAGDVTVRANGGGQTLRQHVVNARAGTVTLTEIQP
jgi:hypothetical protein